MKKNKIHISILVLSLIINVAIISLSVLSILLSNKNITNIS